MTAVLAVALSWLLVIAGMNHLRWMLTEPAAQALALLTLLVVIRPTLLVLGLDRPFPDNVFGDRDVKALITSTQLWVIVWIAVFLLTHHLVRREPRQPWGVVAAPTNDRAAKLAVVLAILALATTVPFVLRYGGPGGLTSAAKSRELDGVTRFFRMPSVLAAYLGAALASARSTPTGTYTWKARGTVVFLIGAGCSYAWGARDAAIFPLLLPLVQLLSKPRRLSFSMFTRLLGNVPRLAFAAFIILGASFMLRTWRDVTLNGRVQTSIEGQSRVRQISVSSNLTQYDAMLLVVADTPGLLPRGGVNLLVNSTLAGIPSQLRVASTTVSPPAITVAKHYEPNRKNGWPLTPIGDWFFALGGVGVLIGAALSGFLIAKLGNWVRNQAAGANVATNSVCLLLSTSVLLGGILMTTPSRAANFLVPLGITALLMRLRPAQLPIAQSAQRSPA